VATTASILLGLQFTSAYLIRHSSQVVWSLSTTTRTSLQRTFFAGRSSKMMSPTPTSLEASPTVNLLDLAAASVACTVSASRAILKIAETIQQKDQTDGDADAKNTRLKQDGSFVTDADFAAQGVIVQAIRTVSKSVRIVGEESEEEMREHIGQHEFLDDNILQRTHAELRMRYAAKNNPQSAGNGGTLPLAQTDSSYDKNDLSAFEGTDSSDDPEECIVDASRVSIIVDPLDGTKSYAYGEYDCVSILIAIVLDNTPWFGVIGKPFGYTNVTSILDSGCACIYGGPLLDGVYVAGGRPVLAPKPVDIATAALEDLPRTVISGSRSKGVVQDFCIHLGEKGLVYPEPMLISGAGEKSLRLMLQRKNEALWFFPKPGTSLWDVAAPDALLRTLGGKMTDKFGNEMDYSKSREEAENVKGVVACIDAKLHAECIRLFQEGDWSERS